MTLTVAIQSPEYLPGLEYFSRMLQADVHVFLDSARLPKRDETVRTRILGPNGPEWLTVPVLRSGRRDQRIAEALVDDTKHWRKNHLQKLRHFYGDRPYFEDVYPVVAETLISGHDLLAVLNGTLIAGLAGMLRIESVSVNSSSFGIDSAGTQLLVDIVRKTGGTHLLLPDYAREFTDENLCRDYSIEPLFHRYYHPGYSQYSERFYPGLSIFDALCNCGRMEVYGFLKRP